MSSAALNLYYLTGRSPIHDPNQSSLVNGINIDDGVSSTLSSHIGLLSPHRLNDLPIDPGQDSSTFSGESSPTSTDKAAGYAAIATAGLFFGTAFIPAKKYDTGNGFFYQWCMCCGILLSTLVLYAVRGFPVVVGQWYCFLGGLLWCTGNLMAVPVIKRIGMSLGCSIWGCSNMLVGWASGFLGILGVNKDPVTTPWMNLLGAFCALIASILFVFIKPAGGKELSEEDMMRRKLVDEVDGGINRDNRDMEHFGNGGNGGGSGGRGGRDPGFGTSGGNGGGGGGTTIENSANDPMSNNPNNLNQNDPDSQTTWQPNKCDQTIGTILAILSGCFYGVNFNPVIYVQNNFKNASQEILDYVFWHFLGIYCASTMYFTLYIISTKNRPKYVSPELIFPGMVSGVLWAVADISWFIANANLGMVVAFPLVTSLPGLVAAFWGVVLFSEIQGRRNFQLLGGAFGFLVLAGVLIAVSQ